MSNYDNELDDEEQLVPMGAVVAALDEHADEVASDSARALLQEQGRTLPHALDAERALLGAVMMHGPAIDDVLEVGLRPADFYRAAHATIWAAVLTLHGRREPVDTLTVTDHLQRTGELDACGGAAAIAQLEAMLPTAAHASAYAKLVREKSTLRSLIGVATNMASAAFAQRQAVEAIVAEAQSSVLSIDDRGGTALAADPTDMARDYLASLDRPEGEGRIPTGFRALDRLMRGGLARGRLVLVAARPAMGKSALAQQIAEHVAATSCSVAYFSLEMPIEELAERSCCARARVPTEEARFMRHRAALVKAAGELSDLPIHYVAAGGMTLSAIQSRARRLIHQHGVGLVVVDHLGLTLSDKQFRSTNDEVGEVSKQFKRFALVEKLPVILLSQLNREVEKRTDKRPVMSDLRDSGSLEQDADVIAFLYRDEYYSKEKCSQDMKGVTEIGIAKNRGGRVDKALLHFDGPTTSFRNIDDTEVTWRR
jgi:replicative DNA helicase